MRGGFGLFFDRPFTTALSGGVNNPPSSATVTAQYAQLQSLGGAGLSIAGAPGLTGVNFDSKLPASTQWNVGMQAALPWATTVDLSYVGSHGYDLLQQVNINAIDFGAAFLPQNQDPTQTSTTPGAAVVSNNQMRAIQGYGNINLFWNRGWRTYHSLQLSFQRRFQNGAVVRVQRHDRPVRPAAGRRAPAAQRRRLVLDSRRPGGGRRAPRPEQPGAERDARELHLGPARPQEQPVRR